MEVLQENEFAGTTCREAGPPRPAMKIYNVLQCDSSRFIPHLRFEMMSTLHFWRHKLKRSQGLRSVLDLQMCCLWRRLQVIRFASGWYISLHLHYTAFESVVIVELVTRLILTL